ncbi:MAG: hypothetical protein RJB38_815 [Pseudomonadota bacterium]|jgi:hypothetical protein
MIHEKQRTWLLACGLLASLALGASARADDDTVSGRIERTEREAEKGPLQREIVGIKPQAGVMVFNDALDQTDSRAAAALIVEMNAINTFFGDREIAKKWYLGPSTGVLYSHMGDPNSNFFGTESSGRIGQAGSNFLIIPVNLKVGYLFPDSNFRLSLRSGGNFTYRSVGDSMNLGPATGGPEAKWRIYPNIGADIELGQLMIRPDLTLTPGNEVFTGTVGFNISLG